MKQKYILLPLALCSLLTTAQEQPKMDTLKDLKGDEKLKKFNAEIYHTLEY